MIYIQPSFFEGSGLTIAEAMDCGAPVITSSKSVITEVVENYAILTESHNAKEISIGIKKMIDERYFAE